MIPNNKKQYTTVAFHIFFWILVCFFFYSNSFLRPFPHNAGYKEFLSIIIIVIAIYTNYLYLIPKFFNSFRLSEYFFFAAITIFTAGIGEFLLLKPNIIECYPDSLTPETLNHVFRTTIFFLIIRDFCFLLFFFILRLYQDVFKEYMLDKMTTSQETHTLTIIQTHGKPIVVKIEDIVYLSHQQNIVYIHLVNSVVHSQYSTLTRMLETLPPDLCLRINRGNIVVFEHIIGYNDNFVQLDIVQKGEFIELPISPKYKESVLSKLKNHLQNLPVEKKKNFGANMTKTDNFSEEKTSKKTNISLKPTAEAVFSYISKHPRCNVPEIEKAINKTSRTIEMHIRELKKMELIEFRGYSRHGGYYVIEK